MVVEKMTPSGASELGAGRQPGEPGVDRLELDLDIGKVGARLIGLTKREVNYPIPLGHADDWCRRMVSRW